MPDLGAQDILMPMSDTPEQAEAAVRAVCYPPRGNRGVGSALARSARSYFLGDRVLPRPQVTTRGYWRVGEANHPDHDFGED